MEESIRRVLRDSGFERNPYFARLKDGSFDQDDFVETQIQFMHAVTFFSRPMAALAAKIPDAALRVEVVRNIWEEHGEGEPSRVHGTTFKTLLARLGVPQDAIDKRALWPEVRVFNTFLAGACVLDEYMVSAALMGMIERMFCDISYWIASGIVANGWLKPDEITHYNLHRDLDVKHAEDFFNILRRDWDRSPENRYFIEQGLLAGACAFNTLYLGLWEGRARRLYRDVRTAHNR